MSGQDSLANGVSKKRSHDEAEGILACELLAGKSEESHLPTPTSHPASEASPEPTRPHSPPATINSSVLSEAKSITPPTDGGPLPTKKQKLNFQEKEAEKARRQSEKEAKDKQKGEEAQRKAEEKLAKDEEKRRKEEEKEAVKVKRELEKAEKQKARDAEKQAKEEAKRKKEEEKNKKERAQLRLGAFFQKPVASEVSDDHSRTPSRRSSVVSLVGIDEVANETPKKPSPRKAPEVKHVFLPFFVASNVMMAPVNRFSVDENLANMAASRLDRRVQQESNLSTEEVLSVFKEKKRKRFHGSRCTVKHIVDHIQGTSTSPIDLTGESTSHTELSNISFKVLSFTEDVRPPYKGTYTRSVSPKSALKLSRRPFTRQLPDTNYDYDSEAEWEPPNEDDEDLESGDDESEMGDDGDEDMEGFLDDEDDPGKRRQIVGDMIPNNSGLCWIRSDNDRGSLEEFRMQTLCENNGFPIDPFSDTYWPKPQQAFKQSTMQPPRLPLSTLNPNKSPSTTPPSAKGDVEEKSDIFCQSSGTIRTQASAATASGKPLKLAPDDVLPAFKQAVEGSDLTKAGLVEILKKQ